MHMRAYVYSKDQQKMYKTTTILTTKNTLIEANQSKQVTWWVNELDSLGINKSSNNNKNNQSNIQELEDHADEIKQTFIHDYKNCYNES
jgi:hypothetical protein